MRTTKLFMTTALGALTLAAMACGGDDVANNNNSTNNNNNATASLQQQALDNGQVEFSDGSGLQVTETLAIDISGTALAAPTTALPSGFDNTDFYGAVDPSAATPWWADWAAINSAIDGNLPGADHHPLQAEIMDGTIPAATANACTTVNADFADGGTVTVFGAVFPVCVISQDIEADTMLPNSHVFVLDGTINVGTGDAQLSGGQASLSATLEIEPGTQLYAVEDSASALVITRGSKIDADGTSAMPILFASVAADTTAANVITGDPSDITGRGGWGGLVLSGFGMENSGDANGELLTEAAPQDQERWFGGTNSSDDSGTVRYVILAESGYEFRPDQEVQGLTLEAAGSGTTIEYVQVIGSEDDCVEWFGGAASAKYFLCQGADDDGLDMDEGYTGTIQFAIVRMGSSNGDAGIESDNNGGDFDAAPQTAPNIANITILGNPGKSSKDTFGALHREGWRGKVFRSVYTDDLLSGGAFVGGCLDIDDALPAALQYRDMVFNCTPQALVDDSD